MERLRQLFSRSRPETKLQAATAETIPLQPIGVVLNAVRVPRMGGWERVVSEVQLRDDLAPLLDGIEAYSHIIVLFYLHLVPPERRGTPPHIHPRGDERYPLQGVLATRTQHRPNPIGVAVVPLLERKGNVLKVRGLDAIDGTPVLDIKPYIPHYDAVPEARMPAWAQSAAEDQADIVSSD